MLTNNKKLTKEFKNIIASITNAKNLAIQELDKIDVKYKALAEKEKSELNKTVKLLETQLSAYAALTEEEQEPAITDTIFPENNVSEEKEQTVKAEPLESAPETIDVNLDESTAEEIAEAFEETAPVVEDVWEQAPSEETPKEETAETSSEDEDEWPDQPEEWNV